MPRVLPRRIRREGGNLESILDVAHDRMRWDALSMAPAAGKGQMGRVEAVECLALEEYLVDRREAKGAAEQADANDAIAAGHIVVPQHKIAIGDDTTRVTIIEACGQWGAIDAFESIVGEGVVGHIRH